ncbi:MAG: helix-turn-helix transcriptional regulator [Treponema sp.]|nr:helix-turn-helix transcriptional regulator [Treponema sp.]
MEGIEVRKIFAENLKKLRKQKGLSQLKLANELQMAFTFINDIENCKKWISPETLAKISTYFNVPVSVLFDSEKDDTNTSKIPNFFVDTICDEVVKTIRNVKDRFEAK